MRVLLFQELSTSILVSTGCSLLDDTCKEEAICKFNCRITIRGRLSDKTVLPSCFTWWVGTHYLNSNMSWEPSNESDLIPLSVAHDVVLDLFFLTNCLSRRLYLLHFIIWLQSIFKIFPKFYWSLSKSELILSFLEVFHLLAIASILLSTCTQRASLLVRRFQHSFVKKASFCCRSFFWPIPPFFSLVMRSQEAKWIFLPSLSSLHRKLLLCFSSSWITPLGKRVVCMWYGRVLRIALISAALL